MTKIKIITKTVLAVFSVLCASAFAQNPYRLAVLEPEGKGISENDQWMLSTVQSVIYTSFSKFSGMTIIDRQKIETIMSEQKEAMSARYSDENRIQIGNLTNASHILSGTVSKTPNAFMLELFVTDLESGERKASYSHPVSAAALENHSAIKEASADLLKQLGVSLTSEAIEELKQAANIARIQAEEALARGIVAKRQGTEVAALSYFYQAAALDPSMLEATNRSSVMAVNISSGNIGADTRNKIVWRQNWIARLTEAEQSFDHLFKTNSLPYTLFYAEKIIEGDIDYQAGTQELSINTNLRTSGAWIWLSSVEKALQAVYDGLEATKMKSEWGLGGWPWQGVTELKPFESKRKTFSIAAELVNDKGMVIGKANFESMGEWWFSDYGRPQIYVSDDDREQVSFASVKADDITDNLTIRIASVNGIDASTAARNGVLQIQAISEKKWDNNVRFKMGRGGIVGYNGKDGELAIPDSIWNEPVTFIGENAFGYKNITKIIIGKNVKVHRNAFGNKSPEFYDNNHGIARTYIYYGDYGEIWYAANKVAFTDARDGKKYIAVKIGSQTWMAENLNYEASGSKCYENKPANCSKYGRLYNWSTARNACPRGWHLPSDAEWTALENAVGSEAGKKLKSKSGWNGTDEFGFSALPGGTGFYSVHAGYLGYWWSATECYISDSAWERRMYYDRSSVERICDGKSHLHSVRCLQD